MTIDYFSDMFCAGRITDDDLQRTMASCGGSVLTTASQISKEVLGSCEQFYEEQVGNERYVLCAHHSMFLLNLFL